MAIELFLDGMAIDLLLDGMAINADIIEMEAMHCRDTIAADTDANAIVVYITAPCIVLTPLPPTLTPMPLLSTSKP